MNDQTNSLLIEALDFDKNGDWKSAHEIIQKIKTEKANWIHAYLHRKEGDQENANYWYNRAKKETPNHSLEQEWSEIYNSINADHL